MYKETLNDAPVALAYRLSPATSAPAEPCAGHEPHGAEHRTEDGEVCHAMAKLRFDPRMPGMEAAPRSDNARHKSLNTVDGAEHGVATLVGKKFAK